MLLKISLISVYSLTLALVATTPSKPQKGLIMEIEVLHGNYLEDASPHKTAQVVKRSGQSLEIENMITFYVLTIMVGSKKEQNKVMIDTGSSDLWVMGKNIICEFSPSGIGLAHVRKGPRHPQASSRLTQKVSDCHMSGFFNPRTSATFRGNKSDPEFHIRYSDKTYAAGVWGTDTVRFLDAEMQMTFGVASKASSSTGKLGLGPMLEEDITKRPHNRQNTNFPTLLKNSGHIKKAVYSIFLNKSSSSKGKIYFGIVDHKKYACTLQTVPIVNLHKDFQKLDKPAIKLDKMYLQDNQHRVNVLNEPIGAILDTGATVQHLPEHVLKNLANLMSGKYLAEAGMYEIDCDYTETSTVVYDFSGIDIKVPLEELVIKRRGLCYLGAKSSTGTSYYKTARLGTSFLRNAYIVYDMEDMEISMSQANYTEDEDLDEVTTTIPRATKAPRYSSTSLKVDIVGMYGY